MYLNSYLSSVSLQKPCPSDNPFAILISPGPLTSWVHWHLPQTRHTLDPMGIFFSYYDAARAGHDLKIIFLSSIACQAMLDGKIISVQYWDRTGIGRVCRFPLMHWDLGSLSSKLTMQRAYLLFNSVTYCRSSLTSPLFSYIVSTAGTHSV
jgi:hypothetical protein